jgi:catechol 2,3-dioxygenase-like lactoylglutathione lyase family enzyme
VEIVGLDHIQLAAPAGCEEAARAFFGGVLGLDEVEKPAGLRARGGLWFALGGRQQLHIGVEEPHEPARKAHPALVVRELDALAARLEAAGATVDWDGSVPGRRRFYTADPWGNRIELIAE